MKYIKLIATVVFVLIAGSATGQYDSDAKVENIDFSIKDADMFINYTLTGTNASDKF